MLGKFNPDNTVVLRGRVIQNDFSKTYKIFPSGNTTAQILFAVYNPEKDKDRENNKYSTDVIPIRMYGHLIDDVHPHGGILERFLSVASLKNTICVYCHISPYTHEYDEKHNGHKKTIIPSIVVDTFRTEGNVHDANKYTDSYSMKNGLANLHVKYHKNENLNLSRNKANFGLNSQFNIQPQIGAYGSTKPQSQKDSESILENYSSYNMRGNKK